MFHSYILTFQIEKMYMKLYNDTTEYNFENEEDFL